MATPISAPPRQREEQPPPEPVRGHGVAALLRNSWRLLTSMRTALVLLFLLALAALPGALLPQRSLNVRLVDDYFTKHPTLAPLLDRVGLFEVFAAPWFAAIYLLLMVSLVGCVLPRALEDFRLLRSPPVPIPRNLSRLPHHTEAILEMPPAEVERRIESAVGGWRRSWAGEGEQRALSAERGYLRELGNLAFHISLIGVLVGFAAGRLFGYDGQVIVLTGGQFCNTGILGYDSFHPGLRVDGTELSSFCVRVDDVQAEFLPNGQAVSYGADIGYQTAEDVAEGHAETWRPFHLAVNGPLRIDGIRVYLLGQGYAPQFTVTFPDGTKRSGEVQWAPVDPLTMLSQGATKFDRPGVTDPEQRRTGALAITGLLAPTTSGGKVVTSVFPALDDPEVAIDVLRGDLGLDDGRGQSIFAVDQSKIDSGELKRVARANLVPGQELRLDDGTVVRFDGVARWANLQVSRDPGQGAVLGFAVVLLAGLGMSLTIRRRRFWARLTPLDGGAGTVVELGGLARTDRAGYGEEFDRLRTAVLEPPELEPPERGG